jgi:23S rRNA (adenine2030-N6)-methyltransferase
LARAQDRLVAIEKQEAEWTCLKRVLAPWKNARAVEGDGYERLAAYLPPAERRGLVLIDPPYEAPDEFERAAAALAAAHRRFATGIYMLWFPIKSPAAADAFCGEVLNMAAEKILRIDISTSGNVEGARLAAAGLVIVNPPFGMPERIAASAALIDPMLEAVTSLRVLAGK